MKLILKSLKPLEEKTSGRVRKNEPPHHSPHVFYYHECSMGMGEPSPSVSQLTALLYYTRQYFGSFGVSQEIRHSLFM